MFLHQVGGLFGREYRAMVGNGVCKRVSRILSLYNIPRYPGMEMIFEIETEETLNFVEDFIENTLSSLMAEE